MASLPHQRAIHSRMQPQRARSKSPIKCVCANFLDFSVCVSGCAMWGSVFSLRWQTPNKRKNNQPRTTYLYRRGRATWEAKSGMLCRKQKGPLWSHRRSRAHNLFFTAAPDWFSQHPKRSLRWNCYLLSIRGAECALGTKERISKRDEKPFNLNRGAEMRCCCEMLSIFHAHGACCRYFLRFKYHELK